MLQFFSLRLAGSAADGQPHPDLYRVLRFVRADRAADVCAVWWALPDCAAAESIQPICRLCHDDYCAFDLAPSYGVHNDALRHAILLLKYEEVTRPGDWFAARLAELVAREPDESRADVVAAVPLHPRPAA